MNRETPWIDVDTIHFEDAMVDHAHGRKFKVLPSPNNSPSSVRMLFNEDELVLEFDYVSPEATFKRRYADGLFIRYGKQTKKIHAFHFLARPPTDAGEALRAVAHALRKFRRVHGNQMVKGARSSVEENGELLRRAASTAIPRLFAYQKSNSLGL